jgi:hypothetical protein
MTTGPRVGDDAIRLRLLVGECRSGAWREGSTGRNPDGERKSRNNTIWEASASARVVGQPEHWPAVGYR